MCGSSLLKRVVEIAPIPLAERYVTAEKRGTPTELFPVDVYMCETCGHVQLLDVIAPEVLWQDYTYESAVARGMPEHFENVARAILRRHEPAAGSLVLDIGSNDGSLLRPFKNRGFRVVGVDPAREIAAKATAAGFETIPDLYTTDVAAALRASHGQASIITAFNAFAHTDDMQGMAEAIRTMLAPGGVFVFEAQYLADIVERALLGTIFHEHLCHHAIKPLSRFLARHGMEIFDVERVPIQGGSIIGYVQELGGPRKIQPTVAALVALEDERQLDRVEGVAVLAEKLDAAKARMQELLIAWKREKKRVCAYGAARSGPTFINHLGLADSIECVFDDHPLKVGKFTPQHHLPVVPTAEIATRRPDILIILAWVHADRIIAKNRAFLEQGGHFVVCSPEVSVIGVNGPVLTS